MANIYTHDNYNDASNSIEFDQKYLTEAVQDIFTATNDFQYPHEVVLSKTILNECDLKQEPADGIDYNEDKGKDTEVQCDLEMDADNKEFVPQSEEGETDEEQIDEEDYWTTFISPASKVIEDKATKKTCSYSIGKEGKFACGNCDKVFPTKARLKSHVVIH